MLTLLLLCTSNVQAQETVNSESRLKIMLPESFSGYTLLVRDRSGTEISESQIDTTGTAEIIPTENMSELIINTETINEVPEGERVYSKNMLYLYLAITALIAALIFYYLGRRRARMIINMLRDEVYEKDLD